MYLLILIGRKNQD